MIIRLILLFLLWLFVRRLWRMYFVQRSRPAAGRRPYPGPAAGNDQKPDRGDITQQKIVDADYEELDDEQP